MEIVAPVPVKAKRPKAPAKGASGTKGHSVATDAGVRSVKRRRVPRHECEIDAFVHLVPKRRIACRIKDISTRGARIRIDAEIKLPQHIFLLIPVLDGVFDCRHCELRWRVEGVAGLKFRK